MARIAFVSCNETPWGGSEELWSRAASILADEGHEVVVAKPRLTKSVEPIQKLYDQNVSMSDLWRLRFLPFRLFQFINFVSRPAMFALQLALFWWFLFRKRPKLIVLSQGGCWDGFFMDTVLRRFDIPYVLICQKASDLYWPPDAYRKQVRRFVLSAKRVFMVSEHNLRLLEEQIGASVPQGEVVRNPFLVDYSQAQAWPEQREQFRLACVGRLYIMEKGQDLLLRVLALPKWRQRDIHVEFYGEGIHRQGLEEMAEFLGCTNVAFKGHTDEVSKIWETNHGLILPSRAEGLPLVLVEAMLAGRLAIVSRAGGSAEVVDDDTTGFLVNGYDETALDEALERAWQRRNEWPAIAAAGAASIRQLVPSDPPRVLADKILAVPLDD